MRRLHATTVVLVASCASALRVRFDYRGKERLIPLQDFSSTSGLYLNLSVALSPDDCGGAPPNQNHTCWDALDHVYAALFSYEQWLNVTRNMHQRRSFITNGCRELATAWSSLSVEAWQQAATIVGSTACYGVGGGELTRGDGWSAVPDGWDGGSAPSGALRFALRYAVPARHDLYTLALYNCRGVPLSASGRASFAGGEGETLSTREHSILIVHFTFLAFTLLAAAALALLMRYHRATALPLHALLVLVLLLRALMQSLQMLPLLMAAAVKMHLRRAAFAIPAGRATQRIYAAVYGFH